MSDGVVVQSSQDPQRPAAGGMTVRTAIGNVIPDVVASGSRFAMAWPTAFAAILCCAIITGGFVYANVNKPSLDLDKFATSEQLKTAIAGVKADYDRISLKIDHSASESIAKITELMRGERNERLTAEKEARETLRSVETRVIDLATRPK